MTAIVGLVHAGTIYMGGDSAAVNGMDMIVRTEKKVFRNGDFLIGYTTSFRMGNLLQHVFVPPKHDPDDDVHKYMVAAFVDAVRACLETGGYTAGGVFLVGYQGRLFTIDTDYHVGESLDPFAACGCGEKYAMGSLGTSKGRPRDRVLKALSLAERFSAGVRAPFHLEIM